MFDAVAPTFPPWKRCFLLVVFLWLLSPAFYLTAPPHEPRIDFGVLKAVMAATDENGPSSSKWVVIISSSLEWKNYRHAANALAFHGLARSLGIDLSHIILLLSHPSLSCEPDNVFPGHIRNSGTGGRVLQDVYPVPYYASAHEYLYRYQGPATEDGTSRRQARAELWSSPVIRALDYCGASVNVETVLALLEGRVEGIREDEGDVNWPPASLLPSEKRKSLDSDPYADVVLYVVGHGYTSYFNFNAVEFISAQQLGRAIDRMYQKGRYRRLLLLLDTCQAITMCEAVRSPNVVCIAASNTTAFSYSSHVDPEVGLTTSSDWMERLLSAVGGDSCFPTPKTSPARRHSALHVPLGDLSHHLLPDDDAMRSFGLVDGLREWTLGDFLCPEHPESVEVKPLEVFHLDDFLL